MPQTKQQGIIDLRNKEKRRLEAMHGLWKEVAEYRDCASPGRSLHPLVHSVHGT